MFVLIISGVAYLLFAFLIMHKKYPLLKKYTRVFPQYAPCMSVGIFWLRNVDDSVQFVFIKNVGMRLLVNNQNADFEFYKISRYRISPHNIEYRTSFANIKVKCGGVEFYKIGNGEFSYEFFKPKLDYNVDTSSGEIILAKTFRIKVVDISFKIEHISNKKLRVWGRLGNKARLEFLGNMRVATNREISDYKRRNFAIINTDTWSFLPKFRTKLDNSLQKRFLYNLLDKSNREISMPNTLCLNILDIKTQFKLYHEGYINIDKLGLYRVLQVKNRGQSAVLIDVITKLRYRFVADKKFDVRLVCIFGVQYLRFFNFGESIDIKVEPWYNLIEKGDLCDLWLLSSEYEKNLKLGICDIIERINLVVLHGFFVDVVKILKSINYQFLPRYTQFLLANLLLSFVRSFNYTQVFCDKKLIRLILSGLEIAVHLGGKRGICFCQKLLPFVQSEKVYQRLSIFISQQLETGPGLDEYYLSNKLGVVFLGNRVEICPSKNIDKIDNILICGKRINLKIRRGWNIERINDFVLGNIYSFEVAKLSDDTVLTFD